MTYKLIDSEGQSYESETPGTLGGHRGNRVYGRLDCEGALRWIAKRALPMPSAFFSDEATPRRRLPALRDYCLPEAYSAWKLKYAGGGSASTSRPSGRCCWW